MVEEIDDALAYFMREIRRSPVFENTNFIFTSDHGMVELDPDELGFRGWVGTLSLCKLPTSLALFAKESPFMQIGG